MLINDPNSLAVYLRDIRKQAETITKSRCSTSRFTASNDFYV
ncbi:hypothetical protein [Actinobacillus arthritidis]|nr:hypothetical protein [Actinobacillus arthritidis]WGE90260.1 hypothetical protein NYR89_05075 [Actinobacillus arthritidis]